MIKIFLCINILSKLKKKGEIKNNLIICSVHTNLLLRRVKITLTLKIYE